MADENISSAPLIENFTDDMYCWILDPSSSPQTQRFFFPKIIQEQRMTYAVNVGPADALEIVLKSPLTSYVEGLALYFKVGATNTGALTLKVDALAVKNVVNRDGTALTEGTLPVGSLNLVQYDGTNFQLLNSPDSGGINTFVLADELTFNKIKKSLIQDGGTRAFTLDSSGNIDGKEIEARINLPASVPTFSTDFEQINGGDVFDDTKLLTIWMRFDKERNKADYFFKNLIAIDEIAPTVVSATVFGSNDTELVVVFDEVVTILNLVDILTDFTVGIDRDAISVVGSGTDTLTFTLDGSVLSTDVFTFGTTVFTTIFDLSGNPIGLITPVNVINNVSLVNSISPENFHLPMSIASTDDDPTTIASDVLLTTVYDFDGSNLGVPRSIQNTKECLDFGVENLASQSVALSGLFQDSFSMSVRLKLSDGNPAVAGDVCFIANGVISRFFVDVLTDGKITVTYTVDSTSVFARTAAPVFSDGPMADFVQLAVKVPSGGIMSIWIDGVQQTLGGGALDGDISALTMANFDSSAAKFIIGAQDVAGTAALDCFMREFTLQPVIYTAQNLIDLDTL